MIDPALDKHADLRKRIRDIADQWGAYHRADGGWPGQSAIASVSESLSSTSSTKSFMSVKSDHSFASKIPPGVETSELVIKFERALLEGDAAGMSRYMWAVRCCHIAGDINEKQREIRAAKALNKELGTDYTPRGLRDMRNIGEVYLIAKLL